MNRLDGNSILIIEGDRTYCEELRNSLIPTGAQVTSVGTFAEAIKSLELFDFDIILCSYYLPDGLIHHVIDWSREHLQYLPIFVAIGSGIPGDEALLHRHLISCIFSRNDGHEKLIKGLQGFLFDFNKFYESLLSMVEPRGINIELTVKAERLQVTPIEITGNGILISLGTRFENGTFALLRVSVFDDEEVENYTLIGSLGGKISGGQHFKVNESYEGTWSKLLTRLEERQLHITGFMRKVAGK